jgi:hypothetical protein
MTNQFPDATKMVFPPNDLSHLSDEEFNALAPQGYHATGPAEPLSPAAQAVMDAYVSEDRAGRLAVAAALRAAADQVVPEEVRVRKGMRPGGIGSTTPTEWMQDQRLHTRRQLLAIADELETSITENR